MHSTSPSKLGGLTSSTTIPRLGSGLAERNIPSPNGRRDPSTPSRVVRSTRTPPSGASQLVHLPPLESIPVHSRAGLELVSVSNADDVLDEAVGRTVYEQRSSRGGSIPNSYDDPFESDVDDEEEESPERSPQIGCAASPGAVAVSTSACTDGNHTGLPPSSHPQSHGALDGPVASVSPVQRQLGPHATSSSSRTTAAGGALALDGRSELTAGASGANAEVRRSSKRVAAPCTLRVEKKERIGRGSFGDVYRAIDLDSGSEIAVKEIVITQDWTKDLEKQIHTLEREIRVMQKLDNPHTVKYLGSKRLPDALNIFMEFVSGGTIASLLRSKGPLSEDDCRTYTRQLLLGLDYLHDKRIAHRDLKGDNLFLTSGGVLKLGDFGTSKELQTMRVTDSVAGTPNFMAPEVISCSGHSYQADIWSVGCCVIQMLTGKPPFSHMDNHMAVMFAVMKGQIGTQIPAFVSPALRDFLNGCFFTEPAERLTTKQLLRHPWIVGTSVESGNSGASHATTTPAAVSVPRQPTPPLGPPPPTGDSAHSPPQGVGRRRGSSSSTPDFAENHIGEGTVDAALSTAATERHVGSSSSVTGGGGDPPRPSPPPSRERDGVHRSAHAPIIAPPRTVHPVDSVPLHGHPRGDGEATAVAPPPPAAGSELGQPLLSNSSSGARKSPPPSAGKASQPSSANRSQFVSRFPRHGSGPVKPVQTDEPDLGGTPTSETSSRSPLVAKGSSTFKKGSSNAMRR